MVRLLTRADRATVDRLSVMLATTPLHWSFEPLELVPLYLVAFAYARRARTLARRGRAVPRARQAWFFGGLALIFIALVSPIHELGEDHLLWVHMVQHLLLGDLAALALVLGLSGPLLRPVLAVPLLRPLRALAHPLVALPLWTVDLYAWHLPVLYQAALEHSGIHALQHACFLTAGILMWAAVVEPIPGPAWFGTGWKAAYTLAVRLAGTLLANIFIWAGHPFYPHYAAGERSWGISPRTDQIIAGSVMMIEGSIVTLVVFGWLFMRWARESELRQTLVEEGVDPVIASRTVRYGRRALPRAP